MMEAETDWQDRALDAERELEALRAALAFEARVVEAHYEGYKTFPKTRRRHAEAQVARMRAAALSASRRSPDWPYHGTRFFDRELAGLRRLTVNAEPVRFTDTKVCRSCNKRAPWCSCGAADYA